MIVRVKNKFISWGGGSYVVDENDNHLYEVKGKIKLFSPTRKKKIYNSKGEKIYTVRNKFWRLPFSFNATLIYDKEGELLGKLQHKFSRRNTFVLEGDYYDSITLGREEGYRGTTIRRNDEPIAVFKNRGIVRDNFEVECFKEEDLDLVVSLVISVDNIKDKNYRDND